MSTKQIKTKSERREEERQKLKVKKQRGGTLAGQIKKAIATKGYKSSKKYE